MTFLVRPVLIFGGTGSLGRTLTARLIEERHCVIVFSRDEAKQHKMAQDFPNVTYVIGDIRDYESVERAIKYYNPGIIINAAAMKQVPTCEFFPYEAIKTNTLGTYNVVKAIENLDYNCKALSISTDKACKPVNSYGMTKALQERIHLNGRDAVFNCVRYGNVLESTGSVIPIFKKLAEEGKTLSVTHPDMTRFLLSLDQAVDLIFRALEEGGGGKIFIPKVRSAKIMDLAEVFSSDIKISGIRPGEKIHEILVSEEELVRTQDVRNDTYVIHDIKGDWGKGFEHLKEEYSSANCLMTKDELETFLDTHGVFDDQ